ncbi:MAG: PilN domain-containing protein [Phycisphaerae bacterium]|jgi:Tfp pilus assembly protein PilN
MIRQLILVGLATLGVAALAGLRQGQIAQAHAEMAALEDQSAAIHKQMSFRQDLERQQADLMIKKRIDDQLGSRVNALEVLAEMERLLPETIFLTNLNLEAKSVPVPVKPADRSASAGLGGERITKRVQLTFTGLAPTDVDLANFIAQMSACKLFEDVSMGYSRNVEYRGRTVREFQASCYVVR